MTKLSDYDPDDGWDDDGGAEQCPHCERTFGTESGYHGPVYDQAGREYEFFHNTDPAAGPYFCPECYPELEAAERADENHSITEWQ